MKRIINLFDRILPGYARRPLLAVLAMNFIAYYLPKLLQGPEQLRLISTPLDDALPLVPGFIFIYVLAYLQWVLAYVVIGRDSPERCFRFTASELCAKLLAMLAMLIFPTVMLRPAVSVRDFSTWLLDLMYRVDAPTHVFPSMHCVASWFSFRWSLKLERMPRWYGWAQGVFTLLVFASVVLVKQHVWPDILGGVAAAELGMLLSRLLHAERLTARLSRSGRAGRL